MDNFTSQTPHFYLIVFFCFILFKILMSGIHSNPLKMSVIEIQEGFPISSLMILPNLIQCRGTVGMFNTRCF